MKIINQDIFEDDEKTEGGIDFIMDGYYYCVLQVDNFCCGMMRQTIEQHAEESDEWEYPSWSKDELQFKFLKR